MRKKLIITVLAALLIILCTFVSSAKEKEEKDYTIPDCSWNQTESAVYAEWEKPESSTSFTVNLYKIKSSGKQKKLKSVTSNSTSHDFIEEIISNGSGEYVFFVKPNKGKKSDGKESDTLEIDNTWLSSAKKAVKEIMKAEDPYYEKAYNADGTLKSVTMKTDEGNVSDGTVRELNIKSAGNCDIISCTTDLPYEQWKRGESRTLTISIKAKDGYTFTDQTEYKGKLLTYVSNTGDAKNRTVVFRFTPQVKLPAITGLYIDSNNKLRWDKVTGASYYYLTLKDGNGDTISNEKVKSNSKDIDECIDDIQSLQIYASNKTSGYVKSETLKIEDFPEFRTTGQLTGRLVKSGNTYRYETEEGEYLTGWQQLAGSWYFFDESGKAVGPGWWQDKVTPDDPNRAKGGSWYYFDKDHKMLANTTTPDGYKLDEHGRWVQ